MSNTEDRDSHRILTDFTVNFVGANVGQEFVSCNGMFTSQPAQQRQGHNGHEREKKGERKGKTYLKPAWTSIKTIMCIFLSYVQRVKLIMN